MSRLFTTHGVTFCLVAAVSLVPLADVPSAQTPYELGARVGVELDAEEREYFGLFPRLDLSAPVRFETLYGDSVRVVGDRDSSLLAMSWDEAEALGAIVDSFEDYPSVAANPAWSPSARFVRFIDARTPVPHARRSSRIRVLTESGQYQGYALYSTDSLLVLSPTVTPRDPSFPDAFALTRSEITSLDRSNDVTWQRWGTYGGAAVGAGLGALAINENATGAAFGLVIGATFGNVATRLVGGQGAVGPVELNEVTYFNGVRPPELPGPEIAASLQERERPEPRPLPKPPRRHELVSIGVHGNVSFFAMPRNPFITGFGAVSARDGEVLEYRPLEIETRRRELSVPYRIDLSVRPLPWVRFGAYIGEFDSVATGGPPGPDGREYVSLSASSVRPYGEVVVPVVRWQDRRLEVSAGGGVEEHTVYIYQEEPPMQGNAPVRGNRELEDTARNWFTQIGAEVYTTPFSSLFVRYSWHPVSSVEVDSLESRHATFPSLVLRYTDRHWVDVSYEELTIGARIHL